ncbi:MAG: glycosyltransferase family 4 protein [Bacteroidales bacterium]|nr:glycosyltransferase family 4 protein [Bacteroidales bacterium]
MNKILYILKLPPPVTGATIMNKYIAESSLLRKNFKVILLGISYKDKIDDIRILSVKKIFTIISTCFKLIYKLIINNPDLIYFQISPHGIAFFRDLTYVLLIKFFNKPIIYHIHGKGIQKFINGSALKKRIYSYVFKNEWLICLANSLTYDINGIFNKEPYIVNNAIPNSLLDIDIKKNNSTLNLLFISNLLLSKGIYAYISSLEILNKLRNNIKFKGLIVGKVVEVTEEMLNEKIYNAGLAGMVEYFGPKYDNEKLNTLIYSDILVYPTYNDAWPLVILEAMQFGLPVIATKEGAIPEIVDDGVTGFLVEKHRPDQIAEKLEILINNSELRKSMGEAGRKKFIEKYTLDVFEKNMLDVFSDVLKRI